MLKCLYQCPICDELIAKSKKQVEASKTGIFYCSRKCMSVGFNKSVSHPCKQCDTLTDFPPRIIKGNKNLFCSRECYDKYQNTSVNLVCLCGKEFVRQLSQYKRGNNYCSVTCRIKGTNKHSIVNCEECNIEIKRHNYKGRNSISGKFFCSKSCTGKYYTRNKTFGVNRSKFEIWLEEQLPLQFPELEFDFNNKEMIGYELDIFIPKLNIAIEINGPTHYEPIYGEIRFEQTKRLDNEKKKLCLENGIKHHIIDVSKIRNWRPKTTEKHFDEICKIINDRYGNERN